MNGIGWITVAEAARLCGTDELRITLWMNGNHIAYARFDGILMIDGASLAALYLTLHTLSKLFAPILAFTCDEIWLAMPHTGEDDARNVVLNEMNKPFTAYALDSETMARWEHIIAVRTVVNGALEEARAAKVIGKSLEADVHLTVPESDRFFASITRTRRP